MQIERNPNVRERVFCSDNVKVLYLHFVLSNSNYESFGSIHRSAWGFRSRSISLCQTQWHYRICVNDTWIQINFKLYILCQLSNKERDIVHSCNAIITYNSYQRRFIACNTGWVTIKTWSRRLLANWKLHFHGTGPRIVAIGYSIRFGSISNSNSCHCSLYLENKKKRIACVLKKVKFVFLGQVKVKAKPHQKPYCRLFDGHSKVLL